jgi:hypothetical protein
MFYELMGRVHAARVGRFWSAGERGQGTVEYVGLILLVGILLAGVVTASHGFQDNNSIAGAVMHKLKSAIDGVGDGGAGGAASQTGGN